MLQFFDSLSTENAAFPIKTDERGRCGSALRIGTVSEGIEN